MSEKAIVLPDKETNYISVDLDEKYLKICLLRFAKDYIITLDAKILPDLVDALIELQNRK